VIEIKFALQPKQKMFLESVEKYPITFYGGAKGGGKSKGIRDIMLYRRFKYPKTHGAIFRRTYKELEGNHIRPIFKEFPDLKEYWNESKKLLTLPNGSTLEFCYCENERDVENYQGREFEDLGIEEAGQWLESMFRTLLGSNRSSTPGFAPRAMLTGNPGGIGHAWLKRIFIERRFNDRERPEDYNFVQALVHDNPALIENDPTYVHRLNSEPNEALRKAYLHGDWDVFAGQYFSEIRREVHFIKPFPIPEHWTRFGSYDFGFSHPAAFGWFAVDEDGNVYLYREFVKAGLRIDQFANELLKYPDTKDLYQIVAGWDCWTKKNVMSEKAAPTIAEEFQNHGILLTKATIDRVQGANNLRNYLAWNDKPNKQPKFFIFQSCPITFDCLTRMQTDPDNLEDVLKQDSTDGDPLAGDDPYDMTRYGLMQRPLLAEPKKAVYAPGTNEWAKQQADRMEESINYQAQRQKAQEDEMDMMNITMNDEDPLTYYLEKRRR
jgi:phage terminase large subunit